MINLLGKLIKQHNQKKGYLQNDLNKCLYCGKCERCRVKAITVNRKERKWEWKEDKCFRCGHCVHDCPAKSLKFVDEA